MLSSGRGFSIDYPFNGIVRKIPEMKSTQIIRAPAAHKCTVHVAGLADPHVESKPRQTFFWVQYYVLSKRYKGPSNQERRKGTEKQNGIHTSIESIGFVG